MRIRYLALLLIAVCLTLPQSAFAVGEEVKLTMTTRSVKIERIISCDAASGLKYLSGSAMTVDKERDEMYLPQVNGRFYIYNIATGKFVSKGGSIGPKDKMGRVSGIALDASGNIIMTSGVNPYVNIYTPENNLLLQFNIKYTKKQARRPGGFAGPVAVNSKGDIFFSKGKTSVIEVRDWEGNYLYEIKKMSFKGKKVSLPGPYDLAVNSYDELVVIDTKIGFILMFSSKGKFLRSWGGRGDVVGKFLLPTSIAIDNKDRVHIGDYQNGMIQVYDRDGNFLYILVDEGGQRLEAGQHLAMSFDSKGSLITNNVRNVYVLSFVK